MSDMTDRPDATGPEAEDREDAEAKKAHHANMLTLEICFLGFVGLVVVAAFLEALSYQLVSSRTPFVIMAPLFVLIVVHAARLYRHRDEADFGHRLRLALAGGAPALNKVLKVCLWLVLMMVVIVGLGHYAGLAVFCLVLMWRLGKIPFLVSLAVTIGTVLTIFIVFEVAFDVELYRGLFFRWLAGYRDF